VFFDRADGGRNLARALKRISTAEALVLGIPRGGIETACEVAGALDRELSTVVVCKLPLPDDPEAGFGAVAEDGSVYLDPGAQEWFSPTLIEAVIAERKEEVLRRVRVLRGGRPLPDLRGRCVLLVDDGLATGATMRAAVSCCRRRGARRIIAAAPVASPRACGLLSAAVDELIVLRAPANFRAVADYYRSWSDVSDADAAALLREAAFAHPVKQA
jgi:predicted phosphoribosyltransferase